MRQLCPVLLALAALGVVLVPGGQAGPQPREVPAGHWTFGALDDLVEAGLPRMSPRADGPYGMTRREVAVVVDLYAGYVAAGRHLPPRAAAALARLTREFAPEVRALRPAPPRGTRASKPRDYGAPPDEPYVDMETWDHPPAWRRASGLEMLVRPTRYGRYGLHVRLEVWNRSDEPQPVGWPDWGTWGWAFRTRSGEGVDVLPHQPPGTPYLPKESQLRKLQTGRGLIINLRWPSFYYQTARYRRLQFSMEGRTRYLRKDNPDDVADLPPLRSAWVDLPPR